MKHSILPLVLLSMMSISPSVMAEEQLPAPAVTITNEQPVYYISSNSVRVRSMADGTGKVLGELSLNDKVKVLNPSIVTNNMVEVIVVFTVDPINKSEKYFINKDYLSIKKVDYKEFVGKYFVVVNVATETIRLYEKSCVENTCSNKMILESEVVVGEDIDHAKEEKGKGRSVLGSYRVTGWSKFYQDPEGHYPSWYNSEYPLPPAPEASWGDWFSKKFMPLDIKGKPVGHMRGAFGWYTAFVAPEAFGQWTHGTLGWGSDKDKFIKKTKGVLINIVADPRSSGCTRNNNEAIAYLRKMIDIGTPIVKIYAKEEILDPTMANYPTEIEEWKYVLTTNRNHAIDREDVLKNLNITPQDLDAFWEAKRGGGSLVLDPKSPLNQVLEAGTYARDVHPDAIAYTPGEKLNKFTRKIGRKGNVYGIKNNEMHGVFYVDAGLLDGYKHPDTVLESGGFPDEVTPSWMQK
jgi:hypothetical protein